MKILNYFLIISFLFIPINVFGGDGAVSSITIRKTDTTDRHHAAYYDLRNRKTYIQITNTADGPVPIHIQIFQHDRGCDELDFFDELTANDTVIYDMDDIVKNDGSDVPISLQEDSYGYVVIAGTGGGFDSNMIGNFRIIDDTGYEYRTNTVGIGAAGVPGNGPDFIDADFYANFNNIDGAMYADVIGFAFDRFSSGDGGDTSFNIDNGVSFDIFVFDLDEEPLSCDRRNFACGNIMNYGINEDYPNSRNQDLLCPGGGLIGTKSGYVQFTNPNGYNDCEDGPETEFCAEDNDAFVGLIGINNNDGTGSMDIWQLIVKNTSIDPS